MDIERFQMNRCESSKNVVIYGAGNVAQMLVCQIIAEFGIDKIGCIVVSNAEENPYHIMGIPVYEFEEVRQKLVGEMVVIATRQDNQGDILKKLENIGCSKIYGITDADFEKLKSPQIKATLPPVLKRITIPCMDQIVKNGCAAGKSEADLRGEIRNFDRQKVYIPRLVVVLGTKCSLRCKECNNLMPYYKKQRELDTKKILSSLKKILENVDAIFTCELIGGEPFLMSNLNEALSFVIKEEKIKSVQITTNGTILPKGGVLENCKNEKVTVRISDYGEIVDKSRLAGYLKENSIYYCVQNLGNWISSGGVEKRYKSEETLKKEYSRCSVGYECKTLFEDKVFACARAASLYDLGYMEEDEYLVVDNRVSADMLMEFVLKDYSIACDYCDHAVEHSKFVVVAEQIK